MTDATARPLLFLRVQFDREDPGFGWAKGQMGEWVKSVFEEEKAALLDDARSLSLQEVPSRRESERIARELNWVTRLLADIETDMRTPGSQRRMRIYRGGQGQWVQEVLRDVQAGLYDDLAKFREAGRDESDPEVAQVRDKLMWSVNILRDVDSCLVSLVGPDEDPRG